MHVLLIGACIGFVIGAVLGGGPFGLLGLMAGGAIGAVSGALLLRLFVRASADEYARHTHIVTCPATGERLPVMVSKESARKASFDRTLHPRVVSCPRWKEHGRCDGLCVANVQL